MPNPVQAADLLLRARDPAARLTELPVALRPSDPAGAYAIQRAVSAALGPVGGWKVGATGPGAPVNCAPLPAAGITPGPGRLPRDGGPHAVEAEVAFQLGRDLPPRQAPYAREEIEAALATAHPAIEWLAFRFQDPGAVDPLTALADGLSHGGFVWGSGTADWRGIGFADESVSQTVGDDILRRTGNPAGDMIRLVQWLADEGAVWAGGLKAGRFVTCGSWTGKTTAQPGQPVRVRFPSLGEVTLV